MLLLALSFEYQYKTLILFKHTFIDRMQRYMHNHNHKGYIQLQLYKA
jgi:hypothetical protein